MMLYNMIVYNRLNNVEIVEVASCCCAALIIMSFERNRRLYPEVGIAEREISARYLTR